MADEPIFYDRNWLDKNCTVSVSSGDATKTRLYDRDTSLQFSTSGENSDSTTAYILVEFKDESGTAVSRTVDTVVLLNWNGKSGTIQYWDGSDYQNFASGGTFSAQAATYLVQSVTSQSTERIKINITTTQTANQEKTLGELLLLDSLWAPSNIWFSVFEQSSIQMGSYAKMADGGFDISRLRWAGSRSDRWAASLAFSGLSKSDLATLLGILKKQQFYLYPEPTENPDDFYFVSPITSSPKFYARSTYKGAGYNIAFSVIEH